MRAANTFGDFLLLRLGHLEALSRTDTGKYSIRITGNVRLIIRPNSECKEVTICEGTIIERVVDYHGDKPTWCIP